MNESSRQGRARPSTTTASRPQLTFEASDPPPTSREAFVATLVIAVATVLAYSNTFNASFHLDDLPNIVRNESLRDLRNQWPPSGTRWLGTLSFALNYRLGGLDVFGYHLVNLLIHVCNGLLVFWLLGTTLRTPTMRRAETGSLVRRYLPLAAGVFFVVHPVQTQAVTYIVQRYASLATLFLLLSLVLYAQARLSVETERPSKARSGYLYCLSVAAAAAAMKTKEISFTLPLVAAGYEFLFFAPRRRPLLLVPLAATAVLVPLGLGGQWRNFGDVLGDASRVAAETPNIPRSVYLLTQSRVLMTYVRLLLLPVHQNLDYDFPLSHSLAEPSVLFATSVLLLISASAVFLLIRAREMNRAAGVLVFFGVAWFFVTLSVESSVIPIRDVLFEHRMYLPNAGAACALGTVLLWSVERLRSPRSVGLQCAVALIITAGPLAAATYARNSVWKNEVTLWSDVVAKSPEKARPHNNLGNALLDRGKTSEAVSEFTIALRILPGYADALNNLGAAYNEQGRIDEAIAELEKAISLEPAYASPHNNLGRSFRMKGQLEDAMHEFREALRRDSSMPEAHNNLGSVFLEKGQLGDAAREYWEAMRLDPFMPTAHNNLGLLYDKSGRIDFAMREYREAIRLDPALAPAHFYLGNAYRTTRRMDDAIREYREAIRLDPQQAQVHGILGDTLEQLGRPEEAAEEYRRAFELQPRPEILFLLGRSLQAAGRPAEAIAHYRRFLAEVGQNNPEASKEATDRITQISSSLAR